MKDRFNALSVGTKLVLIVLIFTLVLSTIVSAAVFLNEKDVFSDSEGGGSEELSFEKFSSCTDLVRYIDRKTSDFFSDESLFFNDSLRFSAGANEAIDFDGPLAFQESNTVQNTDEQGRDFSETNVQVEGVDEADIVKTDGKYIYLANENVITVVDANDLVAPKKLAELVVPGNPIEMFLIDNKLVVLTNDELFYDFTEGSYFYEYWPTYDEQTALLVYDVSEPSDIKLERDIKVEGNYTTARLTDGTVYLVTEREFYPGEDASIEKIVSEIPEIDDADNEEGYVPGAECEEISKLGDNANSFLMITSLNLDTKEKATDVILGDAGSVYMSRKNIYLATSVVNTKAVVDEPERPIPLFDELTIAPEPPIIEDEIASVNTAIFKLSADKTNVEFDSIGEVPGTLINRFALSEYDGDLRVATTRNILTGFNGRDNGLYVLNEDMEKVGEITGLADGESIFAVRFIGEKGYVVTFRQVDPLFVFDLSDPSNPILEGELKISGFSDYLHPFDENHIIGIGKDADESSGRALGLKVALFDVSDPNNPVEKSSLVIGARGSDSIALEQPKAFLFDREKELMVIPADVYETDNTSDVLGEEINFSGFLVFDIDLENGIVLREKLGDTNPEERWYWNPNSRSLYIEDALFTFSNNELRTYDLETLEENSRLNI